MSLNNLPSISKNSTPLVLFNSNPRMDSNNDSVNQTIKDVIYNRLIRSLSEEEQTHLRIDMEDVCNQKVINLAFDIQTKKNTVVNNISDTRIIVITALKAFKAGLISINQIASLHIADAAIRDLYTHPSSFTYYEHIIEGQTSRNVYVQHYDPPACHPKAFTTIDWDQIGVDPEIDFEDLKPKYQKPILQRFFNFSEAEWRDFSKYMSQPEIVDSEKFFHALNAPKLGSWSGIVGYIQDVIKLFHEVDLPVKTNQGLIYITYMIAPSFTILEGMLHAKCKALGATPPQLIPTYNRLEENDYAACKTAGLAPIGLYFPEFSPSLRHSRSNSNFKGAIDGWDSEGPFASLIHDLYHTLSEIVMSNNVSTARFRLATIAMHHEKDQKKPNLRRFSDLLIDGELVNLHPAEKDTIFKWRANKPQKFGDLFSNQVTRNYLHQSLREALIKDLVDYQNEWRENFNIGREDLNPPEQQLYDQLLAIKLIAL